MGHRDPPPKQQKPRKSVGKTNKRNETRKKLYLPNSFPLSPRPPWVFQPNARLLRLLQHLNGLVQVRLVCTPQRLKKRKPKREKKRKRDPKDSVNRTLLYIYIYIYKQSLRLAAGSSQKASENRTKSFKGPWELPCKYIIHNNQGRSQRLHTIYIIYIYVYINII